jgi:hypothetical protein
MRHHPVHFERVALNFELLEALRQSLRDLQNLRVVPADDPHVVRLKRHLREKIARLEQEARAYEHAAA